LFLQDPYGLYTSAFHLGDPFSQALFKTTSSRFVAAGHILLAFCDLRKLSPDTSKSYHSTMLARNIRLLHFGRAANST
jgi:hypothetical protein